MVLSSGNSLHQNFNKMVVVNDVVVVVVVVVFDVAV
jgi:hypothetical protein